MTTIEISIQHTIRNLTKKYSVSTNDKHVTTLYEITLISKTRDDTGIVHNYLVKVLSSGDEYKVICTHPTKYCTNYIWQFEKITT